MIDGYKCRDGKVIVVNYNKCDVKTETEREYQDNIEELLMCENIEEYLNDYKYDMELKKKGRENSIENWKQEKYGRGAVICVIQVVLMVLSAFFKPVLLGGICVTFWFLYKKYLGVCSKKIKELESEIDGIELTFDGIEDELKKNKVKIRRLTNDVRVEKEDISSEYKQLNYVEELKKLKEYLELWYVSGANQKNFLAYIEDDSLEDEICEDFSDTEIKTIKRILTDRSKKRY